MNAFVDIAVLSVAVLPLHILSNECGLGLRHDESVFGFWLQMRTRKRLR